MEASSSVELPGQPSMAGMLAADLVELTEELSRSRMDLPAAATMVHRDFKLAVRSFLAVSLTVRLDAAPPVTLTLGDGPVATRDIGSAFSLRLDSDATSRLTVSCYSARPDGLGELALDLAASLDLSESTVDLAPVLPDHDLVPGFSGLGQFWAFHEDHGFEQAALG